MPAALDLLGASSSAVAFEPAPVERERRGAVLEEIRTGRSPAATRQGHPGRAARVEATSPGGLVCGGARGRKGNAEQLLGFYRAWYRPERMAIIAVGDLNPRQVEGAIRERFARIKGSGPALAAAPPVAPLNRDTSFVTLPAPGGKSRKKTTTKPEQATANPDPRFNRVQASSFADSNRGRLAPIGNRNRFRRAFHCPRDKLAQRSGSPLMAAQWFSVPRLPFQLGVVQAAVKPWHLEAGLQALWAELHAIALAGFRASELAMALEALKPSPAARGAARRSGMRRPPRSA